MTEITTGVQVDTGAGVITGTLDGENVTNVHKIHLRCKLTAGVARIAIEDTADDFTAALPLAVFDVKGATPGDDSVVFSFSVPEHPSCRFGTGTNGTGVRFNLLSITGGGTLTSYGWYD